jgi:hypothetical protein
VVTVDLTEIITQAEQGFGPDRDLDRAVWEALGGTVRFIREKGGHQYERWLDAGEARWSVNATQFTGDVDAALGLFAEKLPRWVVYSCGNGDLDLKYQYVRRSTVWHFGIAPEGATIEKTNDLFRYRRACAPTLPRAIIAARLRAIKAPALS